ncbi:MAG: hypothetical protein ACERLM_05715 [Acidimicrobiales bacterium]
MQQSSRQRRPWHRALVLVVACALLAAACSDDDDGSASTTTVPSDESGATTTTEPASAPSSTTAAPAAADAPNPPPVNAFLADSVVPIGHFDPAQSDSQAVTGPSGPTGTLTEDDLTYQHVGPGHFGIAISPEYPDGSRVVWTNGGDRISKLDYDTYEVLAELPIGETQLTAAEADAEIELLDSLEGRELADAGIGMATKYLFGITGVYYLLDVDNTLFVGGSDSIIAYEDTDPTDPTSAIEVRDEWARPADVAGQFVGANITFDGRIVAITDEGWIVVVERDFSDYQAIAMVGAEEAAAHNQAMEDAGFRPGAATWVRNSIAVGDDGGIYAVSVEDMHKVVWDGTALSTDPADGAWTEPYLSGLDAGSGATPALMGFGDEDRFVVITDGEELMNVVLFWRDEIPDDWEQLPDAPSARIAGQLPADMDDPDLTSIQTEQSVVVGGYGAFVVNNDPASIPEGFPDAGTRVLAGYSGNDPMFTPHGIQKFEWDPEAQEFGEAWVNQEVSSANSVPVVSTGSNLLYTVGARDGDWTLEGIDWSTGESAFHWVTGSGRYNSLFSGINLDQEGRVVHTTAFGIVRYEVLP